MLSAALLIYNEAGWELLCKNNGIKNPDKPEVFPVIVHMLSTDAGVFVTSTSVAQAARLVSVAPPEALKDVEGGVKKLIINKLGGSIQVDKSMTYLDVKGQPHITISAGEPFNIEEATDMSKMPGLQEIPTDPAQIEDKQKIAEVCEEDHVLDTERAV
jgi:hypothetical protein